MGSDSFSTGVSAMNTAMVGLATTQHNIANANTPGFNRQEIVLAARSAQLSGAGYVGQGADVNSVKRVYDEFLSGQVDTEKGLAAQLNTYYAQIQQINNLVSDPDAGLAPALRDFFGAVSGVASDPGSIPARQTLLSDAQVLTSRFQSMNQQLTDINTSVNGQITASVTSINGYAQQIAALNSDVVMLTAKAGGKPPNDLLDQRDQLISQLNQEIKTNVVKQSDGSYNLSIGNGQMLVVGTKAYSLQAVQSLNDPTKLDVAYTTGSGKIIRMPQSGLQGGGNLGGFLAFQSQALDATQNSLGLVATGLAGTFNQQHQLGQDMKGALGGNFFVQPVPVVNNNIANTGGAVIGATISDYTALTGSDYSLKYSAAGYTLTRLSDNTALFSDQLALPAGSWDGLTLSVAGAPNPNDSFTIRPTVKGALSIAVAITDPNKVAAAAPMRTNATLTNTGAGKISAGTVDVPPLGTALNPSLRDPVTVTFTDPTHYDVTTVPAAATDVAGVLYDPLVGATLSYNGWTAQITGAPGTGDTFTVGPNNNASSDNRNALLLGGMQTQNTLLGGTTSYQGVYGQMVSQVGNKTRELQVTSTAQNTMLQNSVLAQQAVSGVNLDEEAANLLRYQRAYQAAGKAMQIANTLFDTLLNLRQG